MCSRIAEILPPAHLQRTLAASARQTGALARYYSDAVAEHLAGCREEDIRRCFHREYRGAATAGCYQQLVCDAVVQAVYRGLECAARGMQWGGDELRGRLLPGALQGLQGRPSPARDLLAQAADLVAKKMARRGGAA